MWCWIVLSSVNGINLFKSQWVVEWVSYCYHLVKVNTLSSFQSITMSCTVVRIIILTNITYKYLAFYSSFFLTPNLRAIETFFRLIKFSNFLYRLRLAWFAKKVFNKCVKFFFNFSFKEVFWLRSREEAFTES